MSSKWYCFTDDESGPFSFQQLAEQIARGGLLPSDLVRRAESSEWSRVDRVLGLMRAAQKLKQSPAIPFSPGKEARWGTRLAAWCERRFPQLSGRRVIIAGSTFLMFCALLQALWIWRGRPSPFPEQPARGVVIQSADKLHQMRPPSPLRPTFPHLPPGVPQIVPGFEEVPWLKHPTLSRDLLTIVYVTYIGPGQLDDLMIATRNEKNAPFQNHRPLKSVNTNLREAQPALSPDGKELLFVQLGSPVKFRFARRESLDEEFRPARDVKVIGMNEAEQIVDAPQFISAKRVRVSTGDEGFQNRSHWISAWSGDGQLRLSQQLVFQNPWPRLFVNQSGQRAYLLTEHGLDVTLFSRQKKQFEEPENLFSLAVTGPDLTAHDDTCWVTPSEDVVFYCGPGVDAKDASSRRLWMLRF